jgi:hypothetical protein
MSAYQINSSFTLNGDGGFLEASEAVSPKSTLAGLPVFGPPQKAFCLSDGSSQVPNLRASEIFCGLWSAYKYPNSKILTDIMVTGSVGQFAHVWGPWEPDEEKLREWFDFYSPYKSRLKLVSLAPISAVRFKSGDIPTQRLKKLEHLAGLLDGSRDFDVSSVLSRIEIVEFLSACEAKEVLLDDIVSKVPPKKAIGTWTCPCCSVRISLRFDDGKYYITDSYGNPVSKNCWGAQAVAGQVTGNMKLSKLVRVTGIELNFFASVCLHDLLGNPNSGLLIRDYSNPRGSIAESLRLYGERVRLTTRNYLVGLDGDSDMTFDELCSVASSNPTHLVECMNLYPVISSGYCLMLNLRR